MYTKFTFSSVLTTADLTATETAIGTDIPGDLQLDTKKLIDSPQVGEVECLDVFITWSRVTGIGRGVKAVQSTGAIYKVKFVEDFEDHLEIYMRKE